MGIENNIMSELEKEYDDYILLCRCATRNLKARILNIQEDLASSEGYNVIESFDSRIKSFDSTLAKLRRNQMPFTVKSMRELHDIAGVRILTPFRDDIEKVVDMLRKQKSLQIVEERDYVTSPKDNGYSSYHVIANMTFHLSEDEYTVPVEIQIRDLGMNYWAQIEHKIRYANKKAGRSEYLPEEVAQELDEGFREIAAMVAEIDKKTLYLRNLAGVHAAVGHSHSGHSSQSEQSEQSDNN